MSLSKSPTKKPLALLILDGWGYREDIDNNAIAHAKTPHLDRLTQVYPNTLISGSGLDGWDWSRMAFHAHSVGFYLITKVSNKT